MRQLLRYGLLGLALGLVPFTPSGSDGRIELVRSAEARPMRHPVMHALLQDLTWIEAFNGERDDQRRLGQPVVQRRVGRHRISPTHPQTGNGPQLRPRFPHCRAPIFRGRVVRCGIGSE